MKISLRTPFALTALLFATACEVGPIDMPPVDIPVSPAAVETPVAVTPPVVSGASQAQSVSYGPISQYLGASDAQPDGRGLTNTRNLKPEECGRGCVPTPGQRPLDASRDRLVDDTVRNVAGGGTSVIRVTGSVDNQQRRIKADDSRELAANRARETAQSIAKDLRTELKEAGVTDTQVRAVQAGSPAAAKCGTGGLVCVIHQAHPQVLSDCKSPANGGCQLDLGRLARATAVHSSSYVQIECEKPPCTTTTTTVSPTTSIPFTTTGGGGGGDGVGGTPNPGSGVFGSFPSSNSGSSGSNGGASGSNGGASGSNGGASGDTSGENGDDSGSTPVIDNGYFVLYPEDRFELDDLSVRIVVDVPRTFRVGGTLTEQGLSVGKVVVYCGASPCAMSGAPTVGAFAGRLSLGSNSSRYRLCATSRSSGCEYYVAAGGSPAVGISGSTLTGGELTVGFLSPTATSGKVLPTLAVEELTVFVFDPAWVGGDGCDAGLPPKSCWEWVASIERDMTGSVSVVSTTGEVFSRTTSGFRLERTVYGTVGSR